MNGQDTIAAIATPPGIGGIGVIRISGPLSLDIARRLTESADLPTSKVLRRTFLDAQGQVIDDGIVLVFETPRSFTGEDVVEIQGHGGSVLQEMLLGRLCELGARLAMPGEFSQRAFENGKIDLTQAEAIADLIESGSQAAARAAMRSLQGKFSKQVHQLVEGIIQLRVYVEGALDFAEEEIDFLSDSSIDDQLQQSIVQHDKVLNQARQGQVLNEGMTMAIAGLPNAGKSSLLNYLAGFDAAIVTPIEGTTRDVIRAHIALKGVPVHVVDTAGLRDSDDLVEQEGIKRAWEEIDRADIVLHLVDATKGFSDQDREIEKRLTPRHTKRVYTKCDLLAAGKANSINGYLISTKKGVGVQQLIDDITAGYGDFNHQESTFIARKRHVEALQLSLRYLKNAKKIFAESRSGELMAEDLRLAQQALNEITGEFTTEDLLGRIFSSFCIGK